MSLASTPLPVSRPAVTTTDWLKLAGVALLLVDHAGLFFVAEDTWWRAAGRLAAPIFFFLIGFGSTRTVPWSWLALGAVLTGADAVLDDGGDGVVLNILLNFALVRVALRGVDVWATTPGRLFACAVAAALIPWAGEVLEYGSAGWLWALLGVMQAKALAGDPSADRLRLSFAAVAVAGYAWGEIAYHDFEPGVAAAMTAGLGGLALLLMRHRRGAADRQPPAALAPVVAFAGRRSLEIYAISLLAMQVAAHVLHA